MRQVLFLFMLFSVVNFACSVQMIRVKGGTFQMGNEFGDGYDTEEPVHTVTVSDFKISKHEVTNAEFCSFLNAKGNQTEGGVPWVRIDSNFTSIEYVDGTFRPRKGYLLHPVNHVSWYGARAYCQWAGGRLPTEAEWEYAARGGRQSNGYKYSGSNLVDDVAWTGPISADLADTHRVGTKNKNELGIHDMSGNVGEWCSDWYEPNYYSNSPQDNPKGPSPSDHKVIRGGSIWLDAHVSRVTSRGAGNPEERFPIHGIRICESIQ